jgi:hypothetical protein
MRIVFAIEPSGIVVAPAPPLMAVNGWFGSLTFPYDIDLYPSLLDKGFRVFLEIVFVLWTFYNIFHYFKQMLQKRRRFGLLRYFFAEHLLWRVVDLVLFTLMLLNFILRIYFVAIPAGWNLGNAALLDRTAGTSNFRTLFPMASAIQAVTMLILTFRVFKYFHLHPGLGFISRGLRNAASDLAFFFIVFGTILVGYTLSGWYYFGHGAPNWSTFVLSLQSTIKLALGETDITDLLAIDTTFMIITYVYFFTFVVLITFIMINVYAPLHCLRPSPPPLPPKVCRDYYQRLHQRNGGSHK